MEVANELPENPFTYCNFSTGMVIVNLSLCKGAVCHAIKKAVQRTARSSCGGAFADVFGLGGHKSIPEQSRHGLNYAGLAF